MCAPVHDVQKLADAEAEAIASHTELEKATASYTELEEQLLLNLDRLRQELEQSQDNLAVEQAAVKDAELRALQSMGQAEEKMAEVKKQQEANEVSGTHVDGSARGEAHQAQRLAGWAMQQGGQGRRMRTKIILEIELGVPLQRHRES